MNEAKLSIKCKLTEVDKLLDRGEGDDEILEQVEELENFISYDEIKKAVWEYGINKSSGPNGFTFEFFQKYWKTMGQDIVAAVTEFFSTGKFPHGCNSTFIALIPKIHDAKIIKDFRPISLIGSIYKIIAKILANHLSLVIPNLINEVQIAFVPNRQILDGPFILNELISWCNIRREFFHGADKVDRKIVWVRWEKVLVSKSNGGLSVSSLYATSGLFFSNGYGDLSLTVLPSGLVSLKQFMELKETRCFSKKDQRSGSICQELVREFAVFKSKDIWHGDSALKMTHSRLFALELKKDIIVAEKMSNAYLNLSFLRLPRSGIEDEKYKNLVSVTSDVLFPQMHDRWSWPLNASGDFTIRLPTRFNLSSRGLEIHSILCPLCNVVVETTSHIFFSCSLSRYIMHTICRWWELDISSFNSYVEWFNWLSIARIAKREKEILEGIFGELVVGDLVGELVVGDLIVGDLMVGELILFGSTSKSLRSENRWLDLMMDEYEWGNCSNVQKQIVGFWMREAMYEKLRHLYHHHEDDKQGGGILELRSFTCIRVLEKTTSRDEEFDEAVIKKPTSFNLERKNIKLVNSCFPDQQKRVSRLINSKEERLEATKISDRKRSRDEFEAVDLLKKPLSSFNLERNNIKVNSEKASFPDEQTRLRLINSKGTMEGLRQQGANTYNYLLQGYLKNKFYDYVKMILHRMEEKDHYLYETTLSMLRASVAAGSLDATLSKLINKQSLYVS
ncbi:RNA-directed DNA polymerase, eukaryota [Tanacetum coccineum]